MNIFKNRPLCLATVFFVLMGFLCLFLDFAYKLLLGGILLVTAGVLLFILLLLKRFLSAFVLVLLSSLQCFLFVFVVDIPTSHAMKYDNETHRVDAYVKEITSSENGYYTYLIRTERINGKTCAFTFDISTGEELALGERFSADISLFVYHPDTIFKYSYPFANGITGTADLEGDVTRNGYKTTPAILATKCRNFLCELLDEMYDKDTAALLRAMLLGDRSGLSSETNLSFQRAGITHLLALSGTHISLLSLAVLRVLKWMRVPYKTRSVITILFVVLYSLLVGMPLSILRASGMTLILLIGNLIRRERDAMSSLAGAALVILLLSPRAILDIGFWLSVMATLGILLSVEYHIGEIKGRGFRFWLLRLILTPLVMTVSASLFTLPITTFIFGEISLLSLPANLIFPGLLNYVIYFGLAAIPIWFMRPLVNIACNAYLRALRHVTQMRGIILSLSGTSFQLLLLVAVILILILLIAKLKHPKRMLIPIGIISLACMIAASVPHIALRREVSLTYKTYEVDTQDYIITKDHGHNLAYISSAYTRMSAWDLSGELRSNGVYELDVLYLSHYHNSDFHAFLDALGNDILIYEIAAPVPHYAEETYAETLRHVCQNKDIPLRFVAPDEDVICGDTIMTPFSHGNTASAGSHMRTAATFKVGRRAFYYASAGYYQAMPHAVLEKKLAALSCDTLIFGGHNTDYERSLPCIYPLDTDVTTIVFSVPESGMALTDEERLLLENIEKINATDTIMFPCK